MSRRNENTNENFGIEPTRENTVVPVTRGLIADPTLRERLESFYKRNNYSNVRFSPFSFLFFFLSFFRRTYNALIVLAFTTHARLSRNILDAIYMYVCRRVNWSIVCRDAIILVSARIAIN